MYIKPFELFNLLQDHALSKLIVDTRQLEEFATDCIRASVHVEFSHSLELNNTKCTKYSWDENKCSLKDAKDWGHRGILFRTVVLYDNDGQGLAPKVAQLLQEEGKVLPQHIKVLEGGFASFAKDYSFICSSMTMQKKATEGSFPSEVFPQFMYLGGYDNATNRKQLDSLGITHILNMADELENVFEPHEFVHKTCGVNDTIRDDISKHFDDALAFIESARKSPKHRVLVHCAMGISRSSAVVCAWLMKENHWTFQQARDYLKLQRSCIKPNPGFIEQLLKYDQQILHG